jgi:hypothetical protein
VERLIPKILECFPSELRAGARDGLFEVDQRIVMSGEFCAVYLKPASHHQLIRSCRPVRSATCPRSFIGQASSAAIHVHSSRRAAPTRLEHARDMQKAARDRARSLAGTELFAIRAGSGKRSRCCSLIGHRPSLLWHGNKGSPEGNRPFKPLDEQSHPKAKRKKVSRYRALRGTTHQ